MPQATPEYAGELLEGSAHLTPQAVLEILGLGAEAEQFLDPETRRKPLGSQQSVAGFLALLFKLPRIRQQMELKREESHRLAFDYFSSLIGNESTVGVVDLGWSGSIQRNIARILRRGGRPVRTIGCYLACTKRAGRLTLDGDTAHAYLEQDWSRSTILPEVAITACVGSTDSYTRDASGKVIPVLGPYDTTAEERQVKARVRDGILSFQSLWLALRSAKGRDAYSPGAMTDVDRQSAAILYRLMEYPTQSEAARLGVLRHDENYFGKNHSAPLCDEQTPLQLRREGLHGLFTAAKCYWPQGIVARHNPRLVSILRSGWTDPRSLGRLGAWHGVGLADCGITDEELSSLGALLNGLAPDQVVFCGPPASNLEDVFLFLWQKAAPRGQPQEGKPRLIVAGSAADWKPRPEFMARCSVVPGDPSSAPSIRSIRAQLVSRGNVALVLSSEISEAAARSLLNGLAPFLGPQGTVLAACGRFDRHTVKQDAPIAPPVNAWFETAGPDLGYALWQAPAGARPHLCNWIVFRRSPEEQTWNRQWMLTVADLAYAAEADPSAGIASSAAQASVTSLHP
jgi:hypothetical protein